MGAPINRVEMASDVALRQFSSLATKCRVVVSKFTVYDVQSMTYPLNEYEPGQNLGSGPPFPARNQLSAYHRSMKSRFFELLHKRGTAHR